MRHVWRSWGEHLGRLRKARKALDVAARKGWSAATSRKGGNAGLDAGKRREIGARAGLLPDAGRPAKADIPAHVHGGSRHHLVLNAASGTGQQHLAPAKADRPYHRACQQSETQP
jgi:hypothetical protein